MKPKYTTIDHTTHIRFCHDLIRTLVEPVEKKDRVIVLRPTDSLEIHFSLTEPIALLCVRQYEYVERFSILHNTKITKDIIIDLLKDVYIPTTDPHRYMETDLAIKEALGKLEDNTKDLPTYRVMYSVENTPYAFICRAKDGYHAMFQCLDTHPEAEVSDVINLWEVYTPPW